LGPRVVAEVGSDAEDPEGTGLVEALLWDDATQTAWLVGSFGVAAFSSGK
jgi:hypothetical protein